MKKILSILMTLCLIATISVLSQMQAEAANTASGKCGKNITWSFSKKTGTLTIKGKGEMYDEEHDYTVPWWVSGKGYLDIKKVIIMEGVTSIGAWNFSSCDKITEIKLPNSLKTIGKYAFYFCGNLKSITLPKNLETIERGAFRQSGLKSVTIPEKVKNIYSEAFLDCGFLDKVTINGGAVKDVWEGAFHNTKWYNRQADGLVYIGKYLYDAKGKLSGNLSVKSGTIGIVRGAFNTIEVNDGEIRVGDQARFYPYDYSEVTKVRIPASVKLIGDGAFAPSTPDMEWSIYTGRHFIDLTIVGHSKSVAEKYANRYGINFEKLTPTQTRMLCQSAKL